MNSSLSDSPEEPGHYNTFAGTNLDRLAAISDGIFAVGMTLLVLGLAVPAADAARNDEQLLRVLGDILPSVVTYFMSFLTLGIFWVVQQTQLGLLSRTDRNYTWLQIVFMGLVNLASIRYAVQSGLMPESARRTGARIMIRRFFTSQALYAVGALLCLLDTRLSIGFIFLVQLNYAIAPKVPILRRL